MFCTYISVHGTSLYSYIIVLRFDLLQNGGMQFVIWDSGTRR